MADNFTLRATIAAHDGTDPQTLYVATQGHQDGSGHYYDDTIKNAFSLGQTVFENGRSFGKSTPSMGKIDLVNSDGSLDSKMNWGFDGRDVLIEARHSDAATFRTVWKGKGSHVECDVDTFSLKLRDRQEQLDTTLQQELFTAAMVGVNEQDVLPGKPQPHGIGHQRNIEATLIDWSNQIYAVSDGPIEAITEVRDSGMALGQNIVLNGDFSNDDEFWTLTLLGGVTGPPVVVNGVCNLSGVNYPSVEQFYAGGFTPGAQYAFSFSYTLAQTGRIVFQASNTIGFVSNVLFNDIPAGSGVLSGTFSVSETFDPGLETDFNFRLVGDQSTLGGYFWEGTIDDVVITPTGVNYSTKQELIDAIIPEGGYHTCLNEGLIRLGSIPVGTVTADVKGSIALSPQLVTNGDFADGETSWTFGSGWSVVSNAAENSGVAFSISQAITLVDGSTYRLLADISSNAGATITPYVGGVSGTPVDADGGYSWDIVASTTDAISFATDGAARARVDNVKLWRILPSKTTPTAVPAIVTSLLLAKASGLISDADFDTTAFAAVTSADSTACSFFDKDGSWAISDALDMLFGSVRAGWGFSRDQQKLTAFIISKPVSADYSFDLDHEGIIDTLTRRALLDDGRGIPPWKVTVQGEPNWTVQQDSGDGGVYAGGSCGLALGVSNALAAWLKDQYREFVSSDTGVKVKHLDAPELVFETLREENNQTFADNLLKFYAGELVSGGTGTRQYLEFSLPLSMVWDVDTGLTMDLGDAVEVTSTRFGLSGGEIGIVLRLDHMLSGGTDPGTVLVGVLV